MAARAANVSNLPAQNETVAAGAPLSRQWHDRLAGLVARGKKVAALAFLERTIARDLPLFAADPTIFEFRRAAWQIRTQLLLEWGRPAEALAWTCLECELAGDAAGARLAQLQRDQLLNQLRLDSFAQSAPALAREAQWPEIAGRLALKAALWRDVVVPWSNPESARRYGIVPPRAILFHGPSGCGKTFIVQCLAAKLDLAPAALLLDALDTLPASAWPPLQPPPPLLLATTRSLDKLAPELRRVPWDLQYYVDLPDFAARALLFRHFVADRPHARLAWDELADAAAGYSAAEIAFLCDHAARSALEESTRVGREVQISLPHFDAAMRAHPPAAGAAA